jgi:hypothetical protein
MNEIIFKGLENEHVKFILDHAFYKQGQLSVDIHIDGYVVKGFVWIVTGELIGFYRDISKMYKAMKGIAVFLDTEDQLRLEFSFTVRGYVNVKGRYKKRPDRETELKFELECTQPQLLEAIEQMESIKSLNPSPLT